MKFLILSFLVSFQVLSAPILLMTVEGDKQGRFRAEGRSDNKILASGFTYSVKSPRDVATGMASGKRMHQPIIISHEVGASSPQFFQALVTNEILKNVILEFYTVDRAGKQILSYTITLDDARVVDFNQKMDGDKVWEDISFTFQKIELSNKTGGTMAEDTWSIQR
jgi:type VI secretion system secreted protein Hcp